MNSKLFVGNLSFDVTENDLQDFFAGFGPVTDVNLITDRATGRSRGFAFVNMATPEGAKAAIDGSTGKSLKGREIKVSEAREREQGGRGGGGGGGGRGGYRGGGGGGGGGRGGYRDRREGGDRRQGGGDRPEY
jgi:RNA recognition motif-containing protein